ncbi:MAG: metal ABC transporter ATP-binding protein [Patescibacteria group bacterium]|nr:metal ABC transporter ATP-binding protein [Patescibacteria group bacterium]
MAPEEKNPAAVDVHHLTVRFGSTVILSNLTFSIARGEIVALIGPNGSGKTTLLQAVLGLVPYEGIVRVFGGPVQQALGKIGYVPQRFSFDRTFPLTVGEFLSLSGVKLRNREWRGAVLEEVNLKGGENRRVGDLSGGQLQRLLIANALLSEPKLLLLDEPTAGVDIAGERGFYDLVSHLHRHHQITIMMVSHDLALVSKRATKIICLNREMVCFGTPEEAVTPEVLKQLYGEPEMNHLH